MPKLKITKNTTYDPGHLGRLLSQLGSGPIMDNGDGTVTTILSDSQMEAYHRMGGSPHKVEVMPDVDPPAAQAAESGVAEPPAEPEQAAIQESIGSDKEAEIQVPTLEEVINAGYPESVAKKIIRRQEMIRDGATPEQIREELTKMQPVTEMTPTPEPEPAPAPEPTPEPAPEQEADPNPPAA